jgi:hypothetical protein
MSTIKAAVHYAAGGGLGSQGAGSDVIAAAVRDAVRALMLGTDACIRLACADAAEARSGEHGTSTDGGN